MKIVFANKYFFLKGGAERYCFELSRLLQRHGHEVIPFAMRTPQDEPSVWSQHFVSPVRTDRVSFGWAGLKTAGRTLWSFEAARRFGELLDEARPKLLHVHNIYHQISPSILPVATRRGLPTVMTVHDYALLAPNYSLFHDGEVCEVTKPNRYCRAVGHRCVKESFFASALSAVEHHLHRRLQVYADNVRRFIVPSRFVGRLLVEYGFAPEKITYLPHFIDVTDWQPSFGAGEYALFVGRLSEEKGIELLIRAAARQPAMPVRIVGTGPQEAELRRLASELSAHNVTFVGAKHNAELRAEYAGARFVVVPSVWYEVFGLVALEAYAAGKPVVAFDVGGLSEVVRSGETGLTVPVGDLSKLAQALQELWSDEGRCITMGQAGRAWVERDFSPEAHYRGLMAIYDEVLAEGRVAATVEKLSRSAA